MSSQSIEQGILSKSDGSARYTLNSVQVLGAVNGPQEVPLRKEILNSASLEINILPLKTSPTATTGPQLKLLASSLQKILTHILALAKYPKSLIQLTLQILALPSLEFHSNVDRSSDTTSLSNSSSTELATLFNAAILACLDANLQMYSTATAISLAISSADDTFLLHPTIQQEHSARQSFVVAYSFEQGKAGNLVWLQSMKASAISDDLLDKVAKIGRKACFERLESFRLALKEKYDLLVDATPEGNQKQEMEIVSD